MFDRAAITLGIGPHSSFVLVLFVFGGMVEVDTT